MLAKLVFVTTQSQIPFNA